MAGPLHHIRVAITDAMMGDNVCHAEGLRDAEREIKAGRYLIDQVRRFAQETPEAGSLRAALVEYDRLMARS